MCGRDRETQTGFNEGPRKKRGGIPNSMTCKHSLTGFNEAPAKSGGESGQYPCRTFSYPRFNEAPAKSGGEWDLIVGGLSR